MRGVCREADRALCEGVANVLVIARSEATKQSRLPPRKDSGLLRFARNDGSRLRSSHERSNMRDRCPGYRCAHPGYESTACLIAPARPTAPRRHNRSSRPPCPAISARPDFAGQTCTTYQGESPDRCQDELVFIRVISGLREVPAPRGPVGVIVPFSVGVLQCVVVKVSPSLSCWW